jgi:hypothetical protein
MVIWTDPSGRRWRRGLPERAPDTDGEYGVPAGPPDMSEMLEREGWPEDLQVAIHNQLADRELWDPRALAQKGGTRALLPALMGALRADAIRLADVYAEEKQAR